MTSKLTRERLEKIKSWRETYGAGSNVMLPAEEAEELACLALAAMDSEPVAWTDEQELRDVDRGGCGYLFTVNPVTPHADERRIILLYRHAQPASEREQVRSAHAEWSQATFGNVGPVGPLKHLSKEALEAAEQPGDLSEWADMQFLLWDAQRRAGITDDQITQAMIDKLAVNKQREWPEPKDGEPRLHIKSQPAPVVPEEATSDSIEILASARRRDHAVFQWGEDQRNAAADSWNACRATMLQELKKSAGTEATCRSNENAQVLTSINPAPDLVSLQKKAESIIGNYPGIPDCWCRTCRPVVLNDMRFVVCPDCGNKRCPRANDHRNACTGSNEPGQEGSAYPDTLQEPKP